MINPPLQTPPTLPPGRPAWRTWKIGLCLAAIFAGGLAVGVMLTLSVLRLEVSRRADPERWTRLLLDQIDHRVHLTPDQRRALEPIVRSGVDETVRVRDRAFVEIGGIVERRRVMAAAILSPDQQRRFDGLIEERARLVHRLTGFPTSPAAAPSPSSP